MTGYKSTYNRKNKGRRVLLGIIVIAIAITAIILIRDYIYVSMSIIKTTDGKGVSLYIPTGSDYQYVKNEIGSLGVLRSKRAFNWMAERTNYPDDVHPGRYLLTDGMTNQELINMLRYGHQTPVKVVFNNMRNVEYLASRISRQIEADSTSIINAIKACDTIDESIFIPNTYEFYWNTDAQGFLCRMASEYRQFWNDSRKKKAKDKKLSPREVSILASIVDRETAKTSEMPAIAGVYLNRLKIHWPLQADPTLIFAAGDYSIKRVLNIHKKIDSPYNTYKYEGLPPGPICIPSIAAIDAVLNAENHKYFYFCAKDDLSGYHVFARTMEEHNRNAAKYRKALNNNKVYK